MMESQRVSHQPADWLRKSASKLPPSCLHFRLSTVSTSFWQTRVRAKFGHQNVGVGRLAKMNALQQAPVNAIAYGRSGKKI
jgi:hypothetical protein